MDKFTERSMYDGLSSESVMVIKLLDSGIKREHLSKFVIKMVSEGYEYKLHDLPKAIDIWRKKAPEIWV